MKLCRTCKKIIPNDKLYCDEHEPYADYLAKKTLEDVSKFYKGKRTALYASKEWRTFRLRVLKDRPVCEDCGKRPANTVHHLSYEDPFDEYQVKTLCEECHRHYYGNRKKIKR